MKYAELKAQNAALRAAIREYRAARTDCHIHPDGHASYSLDAAERLERADDNMRRLALEGQDEALLARVKGER